MVIELPRLLIIDDLFGRTHLDCRNEERANLCGQYLIEDVTEDEVGKGQVQHIKKPVAQAVFCRGQKPRCSTVGDYVENDLETTLQIIQDGWDHWRAECSRWSMVLLDLCFYTGRVTKESNLVALGMPEGRPGDDDPEQYFGLCLLEVIHQRFRDLPVVIFSSKPREEVSRKFSQYGALFLPREDERGPDILRDYIWQHGMIPDASGELVGQSKALLKTLRDARRAAADQSNLLIRGERGTGKELLARYIHIQGSKGKDRPLIIVDSGALSPQLYASELFGHKRGAFTGADRDRKGRIAQANGGDLFLDEIGNMPYDVQNGLLRVLEHHELAPLGALEGQAVDVRFLSATNETLETKSGSGGFRQDLLDRLRDGGELFLPPLRERLEDLDLLIEYLVREAERVKSGTMIRQIEPESLQYLRSYDWPGNIRELKSCIYRAVFSYPDVEHLQPVHLHFGKPGIVKEDVIQENISSEKRTARTNNDLDGLVTTILEFNFDHIKPSDLLSKLPSLQEAYAQLMAGLLKAALQATSKPSPDNPEGKILIHPAIKLITGSKSITASKAADIIKRLFGINPKVDRSLIADPILKEAYETALRLRPRQSQQKMTSTHESE